MFIVYSGEAFAEGRMWAMPRRPRVFVEGGMYHVYSRLARGGTSLGGVEEATTFVSLLGEVKERDDLIVYAWCVLPTHYHLLARTTRRALWRTMATLHSRYSRWLNRRQGVMGPTWQSRYKAKLVEDQRYFDQLVAYIHLNPVKAGLVKDPGKWTFSGHYELVKRTRCSVLDVDEMLQGFGDERSTARRAYVRAMRAGQREPWIGEDPGRLPWWRFGAAPQEELELREEVPFAAASQGSALDRPEVSPQQVVAAAGKVVGVDPSRLTGHGRERELTRVREALAVVACDRYGVRVKDLARAMGKRPDLVSTWLRRAAVRLGSDAGTPCLVDKIDAELRAGSENTR